MTIGEVTSELREALRAFATRELGPIAAIEDRSRSAGRMSLVWHIERADGRQYYLKRHEERRLFDRERYALNEWVPQLPEGARQMAVPMVAVADDLDAMLFEAAPGEIVEDATLTEVERDAVYQMAGAFASALHQLPCEGSGPSTTYGTEMVERFSPWLDDPAVSFPAEIRSWAIEAMHAGGVLDRVELVPTHMDYSPRNWLIHRDDGALWLHIIDWERARPAPWVEDAQRMVEDHWQRDPAARRAFFLGYGREPTEVEQQQLRAITIANSAIGAIGWGTQRGDWPFVKQGWGILERLRSEEGLATPRGS